MPGYLMNFGGAALGGIFGMANTGMQYMLNQQNAYYNNELAKEREDIARRENYRLNEMAADNADMRQRKQWQDMYSYQAQLQNIKKAGLSPALLYSGGASGQGGASAPQGAGGAGIQPSIFPQNNVSMLEAAQIGNIMADTALKNSEVKQNETNVTNIESQIAKNWAEVGAIKASQTLQEAQAEGQKLENLVKSATTEEQITQIIEQSKLTTELRYKAMYEASREGVKLTIDKKTMDNEIKMSGVKLDQMLATLNKTYKETQLTEEEIQQIKIAVINETEHIANEAVRNQIYEKEVEAQRKFWNGSIQNSNAMIEVEKILGEKKIAQQAKDAWKYAIGGAVGVMGAAAITSATKGRPNGQVGVPPPSLERGYWDSKANTKPFSTYNGGQGWYGN